MKVPFIDRIWRVRGTLTLDPCSPADAFRKLDDLFHQDGTSCDINQDTLSFTKKAPRAQDKMAIYSSGTLRVSAGVDGAKLHYDLNSSTLLFCFVLPFLFLGIAWLIKDSRTPAYVFAGIFSALYVAGRILEPWLIKNAFLKRLSGAPAAHCEMPLA